MTTKTISIQHQSFVLHPTGALFWKDQQMLLISDVHLGKVMHFRKHGVALPQQVTQKNFDQLDAVFSYFEPETIVFLGDLFHSKKNSEWLQFEEWVSKTSASIILVAGNHDIINPKHYKELNIMICAELIIANFLLTHHPEERAAYFNFSGHIHPGIKLRGSGKLSLNLPCFFQKKHQMILPAFGTFTGKYFLVPEQHDCVYAIANDSIIKVC